MNDYVVKNCICYDNEICDVQDMFCKDCSNCVLKQIINKCVIEANTITIQYEERRENKIMVYNTGKSQLAKEILEIVGVTTENEHI